MESLFPVCGREGSTHMHARMRELARPVAAVVALTLTMVAALLIGSQATTSAVGGHTADRGTVAKNVNGTLKSKLVGSASDGSKVTGDFTPLKFVTKGGKQQVKGLVQGVVTHADGTKETFAALRTLKVKSINGKSLSGLTARSAQGAAACDVLHLVLGPATHEAYGSPTYPAMPHIRRLLRLIPMEPRARLRTVLWFAQRRMGGGSEKGRQPVGLRRRGRAVGGDEGGT